MQSRISSHLRVAESFEDVSCNSLDEVVLQHEPPIPISIINKSSFTLSRILCWLKKNAWIFLNMLIELQKIYKLSI